MKFAMIQYQDSNGQDVFKRVDFKNRQELEKTLEEKYPECVILAMFDVK